MELKIGNSCGSCIHTNRPKTPREHAAHYEVAKTERWCFKHNCHVTRETSCSDHEGVNRAAKTAFTRIKTYNERIILAHEVLELLKTYGKPLFVNDYTYFIKDNWIYYVYGHGKDIENERWTYTLRTKESSTMRRLNEIKKHLQK